ncbi:MAG: hypothetical protein V2B19_20900 [Pseudomonadota bacterium]
MKKEITVKNPLSIIAIFSGLAEVSGSVVMPLVDSNIQHIYVWFLMLFPCLIVILFFITLYFRPKNLYAPSDYKDEQLFFNLIGDSTLLQKEEATVKEVEEIKNEGEQTKDVIELQSKVLLSEQYALSRIEEEFLEKVHSNPVLDNAYSGTSAALDGFIWKTDEAIGIEVKYIRKSTNTENRIKAALDRGGSFFANFPIEYSKKYRFRLIIALVCDTSMLRDEIKIELDRIKTICKVSNFNVEYRLFTFENDSVPNLPVQATARAGRA